MNSHFCFSLNSIEDNNTIDVSKFDEIIAQIYRAKHYSLIRLFICQKYTKYCIHTILLAYSFSNK